MSYMTGVGLGNALSSLAPGIIQGEEIARRRSREDEQMEQARAEFENRQQLFGRQKQSWTKEDETDAALSEYQASQKTPEDEARMYTRINGVGAGRAAFETQGVIQSRDIQKQGFDLQQKLGESQLTEHQNKLRDQEIVHGMFMGQVSNDWSALMPHVQKSLDSHPSTRGSRIVSISMADGKNAPKYDADGISNIVYTTVDASGKERPNIVNLEKAGGMLGSELLSRVGTMEANRALTHRQLALSQQGLEDGKMGLLQQHLENDKNTRMKPLLEEQKELIRAAKDAEIKSGEATEAKSIARLKASADKFKSESADLTERIAAIAAGYYPEKVVDNGVVVNAATKIIAPIGAAPSDRSGTVSFNASNGSYFMDPNNRSNFVNALVKPMPGEDDASYQARRKSAEAMPVLSSGGWKLPIMNPVSGSVDVIDPSVPGAMQRAKDNGYQPVRFGGFNYGETLNHYDVLAGEDLMEKYKVRKHSAGIHVSGSGVVPRRTH